MQNTEHQEAERLKQQDDVKAALKQTSANQEIAGPGAAGRDKLWFGLYILLLVGAGLFFRALQTNSFPGLGDLTPLVKRISLSVVILMLVLATLRAVDIYFIAGFDSPVSRYTLRRILKLVIWIAVLLALVSVFFANWYTALASLGLASLILGLSLQSTLTSFLGWIYILVRVPYRVGDRIVIGEAQGDVIDVGYLDTTLWEFGGKYLSSDHPSGRIIKFPNAKVLQTAVFNYSWPLFPYIWNEIKFQVGYTSDLEFVAQTMREIAEEEIGPVMRQRVRVYRELLAHTPVNRLEIQEHPTVIFRVNDNTWIEAIVRYLVEPSSTGRVKSRMIQRMLARLNQAPERVLFPKGDAR